MAYKYTAYYYLKNGNTGSVTFTTGYDLRNANKDQKKDAYDKIFDKIWDTKRAVWNDVLEYDIYDSRGVLIVAKKLDAKSGKWTPLIKAKKKEKEWHPFGL